MELGGQIFRSFRESNGGTGWSTAKGEDDDEGLNKGLL